MKMLSTAQVGIMLDYISFQTDMIKTASDNNMKDSLESRVNFLQTYVSKTILNLEEHAIELDSFFPSHENTNQKDIA